MTTTLLRTSLPRRTTSSRTLGYAGLVWALAYVPIHVYWALGGSSTSIGITGEQSGFRMANWAASIVIVGAGLTCLSLTQPWGGALPAPLRRGTAWVGGIAGLAHWLLYSTLSGVRLAGIVGYPSNWRASEQQLRHFDYANLACFELWFGLMGLLLIACARHNRALEPPRPPTPVRGRTTHVGTVLGLGGIAVVVWGVFTFDSWVFAALGPAMLGAGLTVLILGNRPRNHR